jgi:hypothetical protein
MWEKLSNADRLQLSNNIRQRSIYEGMLMENITLEDWLKKIEIL